VIRLLVATVAAAAVGALGALVLGEYSFEGITVMGSGVVLGLFIAEAALAVRHDKGPDLAAACAVIGWAAMTWAGWIALGHDLSFLDVTGVVAIVLTGLFAGGRCLPLPARLRERSSRRAAGSPDQAPAPAAAPPDPAP
jgi:hypothetical protein